MPSSLAVLARTETRLFLREPGTAALALTLPTLILLALGAVPALRAPSPQFGGASFVDVFAPSLLGWSVAFLALQTLPAVIVTYRERGVLRRLGTTPMRPSALLGVQLLVHAVTAVLGMLVMVAVAVLVFDVAAPRHPAAFALTFALAVVSMFGIGLVVAALAPRARSAAGIGTLVLLVTQFFGGLYLPKFLLPEVVNRVGEFVPPAIGAFQSAWTGAGAAPGPLAVLAVIAVATTAVAARFFRWE